MRPGRGGRRKKPAQDNSSSSQRTEPTRKNAPRKKTRAVSEPQGDPNLTGVATPGQSSRAAEPVAEKAAAPAAAVAPQPKKRRTRRAASSTGVGGPIQSGESGKAKGGAVATASYKAPAASDSSQDDVAMLGVGVKASEIRRPD